MADLSTDSIDAVHTPVLVNELIKVLEPKQEGELMIDATLGEGGHSMHFLSNFPGLRIIGIDADPEIQKIAKLRLQEFGDRISFYSLWSHDFFSEYALKERPGIILIDLGVSLFHYEKSGRGFSFRRDEKLDMRISNSGHSALDLISRLSEKELADLIFFNSDERFSRRIAREIVKARSLEPISSSKTLSLIVEKAVPPAYRRGPVHPATKTFQALRIAVNGELTRLEELLENALRVLDTGGRMGVISFHSLEDRIVKNFFRKKNKDCICPPQTPICRCRGQRIVNILTKKGLRAGSDEVKANPPSRSACLRAIEKLIDEE